MCSSEVQSVLLVCCSVFVSLLLFAAVYFSLLQRVASCACVCVCCSVCLRVL